MFPSLPVLLLLLLPSVLARLSQGPNPNLQPRSPHRRDPSRTNRVETRSDATIVTNTCIRLDSAFKYDVSSKNGKSEFMTAIAAGTCLCVEAAAAGGLDLSTAAVDVVGSDGSYFEGKQATEIAEAIEHPDLFPGYQTAWSFAYTDICVTLDIAVDHSHYSFPSSGSCCARQCDTGYVANAVGKCVLNPSAAAKQMKRDIVCPKGMDKCAVQNDRLGGAQWECVNVQEDLESCGGCLHPYPSSPQGQDCTALPNTNSVSCHQGQCHISSCRKGYHPTPGSNGTTCEPRGRMSSPPSPLSGADRLNALGGHSGAKAFMVQGVVQG